MIAEVRVNSPSPSLYRLLRLLPIALLLSGYSLLAWGVELKVEVSGVGGELEKNVLAHLAIYQEQGNPELLLSRIRHLHAKATHQIEAALQPFGYFRPAVAKTLEKAESKKGQRWVARYTIDPGPAIELVEVDYRIMGEGAEDPGLPHSFPLAPGDVLDQRRYEEAKRRLLDAAAEQGYLQAELLVSEIRVDLEAYQASILLHLDSGPRHYFGEVRFEQELLDPAFLSRYVRFAPGDPYSLNRLLRLQGTLLGTDYFRQVEIMPLLDERSPDNRVPLRVTATPNPRNKYRIGVGFATDFGPRITLDWAIRRIGRQGHKGDLKLLVSPGLKEFSGEYRIPLQRPGSDYFSLKPEFIDYDTASREGQFFQLQLAHSVAGKEWRRTLGLDLKYEDYKVAEDTENATELVPHVSWARTLTDDPIYTHHGKREKLTLLGALEGLLTSTSYFQARLSGKWIRSFGDDYRFLVRGDLGATLADDVLDLPGSRRFFAGGDNSVRGYQLDDLGPTNSLGEVVGGRYLAIGSLELERRIFKKWSMALFTDLGNAYDPDFDNEIAVGAGVGLRWRSPLGQIRVDVASALTRDGNPIRLHIVIGPDL